LLVSRSFDLLVGSWSFDDPAKLIETIKLDVRHCCGTLAVVSIDCVPSNKSTCACPLVDISVYTVPSAQSWIAEGLANSMQEIVEKFEINTVARQVSTGLRRFIFFVVVFFCFLPSRLVWVFRSTFMARSFAMICAVSPPMLESRTHHPDHVSTALSYFNAGLSHVATNPIELNSVSFSLIVTIDRTTCHRSWMLLSQD
jgi:hypothetical protein